MATVPEDLRTLRAHRRASRQRAQHLVTADEHSLAELEMFLATLPLCATGRVFIEVPAAGDIGVVSAPARMTVTWLARSTRSGAPGTGAGCGAGQALTRAVRAWADEMLCLPSSSPSDDGTRITLLGGYLGTADIVDHLTTDLRVPADAIYAPERFGLLPART